MLILLCDNRILAVRGAIIRRSSLLCPKECQRKTRCYVLRFFNKCNTFNIDWASVLCSTLDQVLIGEAPVTDRSQRSFLQESGKLFPSWVLESSVKDTRKVVSGREKILGKRLRQGRSKAFYLLKELQISTEKKKRQVRGGLKEQQG